MSQAVSATSARSGSMNKQHAPGEHAQTLPILPPISAHDAPSRFPRSAEAPRAEAYPPTDARNGERSSARPLKMHSILNPSGHDERRTPAMDGPRRSSDVSATSPHGLNGVHRTLPPMNGLPSPFGVVGSQDPARRSCSGSAAVPSSNCKSPYTSTVSTPLMGTPNTMRPAYGFPGASATSSERRGSDSVHTAPQSLTNSPTTSYSSYVPTQRNSPTAHHSQMAAPSAPLNGAYNSHPQPPSSVPAGSEHTYSQRHGSTGTQGPYQMMTLETESGPIQVPVDVQAASKMADEKRKRNAGASARFRQRRKEKEREASQTISRLENKVREVVEEKEYYRMERDYFRDLVYKSPASAHVGARPVSPQQRKASMAATGQAHPPAPSSDPGSEWQQAGERGSEDGRNQRRRISSYGEATATSPSASAPAMTASYATHPPLSSASMSGHAPQHGATPPYPYSHSVQGPVPTSHGGHGSTHYAPSSTSVGYNHAHHAWKPQVS